MLSAEVDSRSIFALLFEWLVIAATMTLALRLDMFWFYLFAGIVIATRQHALLILFHDAVHGHLARNRLLNDVLINFLVGAPALLPVEIYRPLHMLHHRKIGTPEDPERRLLYAGQPWNYRPLRGFALCRQLLGDLFVFNGVRTIAAWLRDGPPQTLHPATFAIAAAWIGSVAAGVIIAPEITLRLLGLWLIPLLSLTQLLQKLRSFAEHSGGPGVTPGWLHWTYSWEPGVAGRLSVWPYNINYHREHHDDPRLRWHQLPGETSGAQQRLPGSGLWSLLHRSR